MKAIYVMQGLELKSLAETFEEYAITLPENKVIDIPSDSYIAHLQPR